MLWKQTLNYYNKISGLSELELCRNIFITHYNMSKFTLITINCLYD